MEEKSNRLGKWGPLWIETRTRLFCMSRSFMLKTLNEHHTYIRIYITKLAEFKETHCTCIILKFIQCVFLDSASFVTYPKVKATEVRFYSWNFYLCSLLVDSKETHCTCIMLKLIQCVSLEFPSYIIYPEMKATEVKFSALKCYLCSFCFRIME